MLLNSKDTWKQSVCTNDLKMVAKLFWAFLPSYLTCDIWPNWSCIPWVVTRPKISKCPQIIVTLSDLKSNFKWLWRVGLTSKGHKKDSYRRQINIFIHIYVLLILKMLCHSKKSKIWENSQDLSWIRYLKARVRETLTYPMTAWIIFVHYRHRLYSVFQWVKVFLDGDLLPK